MTKSLLQKAEVVNLKKEMNNLAHEIFHLNSNLLTEKAHQPCDIIVKEQTEFSPYTNIFGVEWKKSLDKMKES